MCVRACPFYNHVYVSVCACVFKGVSGASMSATERQNTLCVHLRVCVCPCALCAADESFSKSRLAALVFTMPLQLQRPFNLKTSQFESPFAHMAGVSPLAK